MKKSLLIAVLILAVLTSLTAGTFAKYTLTIPVQADVTSKKFNFTGSGRVVDGTDLSFAPGDRKRYQITLNQTSDVDMEYSVTPTVSGDVGFLRYLNTVMYYTIDGGDKKPVPSSGSFSFKTKAEHKTIVITYEASWAGDDTQDYAYAGKSAQVVFNIKGDQYIATAQPFPSQS